MIQTKSFPLKTGTKFFKQIPKLHQVFKFSLYPCIRRFSFPWTTTITRMIQCTLGFSCFSKGEGLPIKTVKKILPKHPINLFGLWVLHLFTDANNLGFWVTAFYGRHHRGKNEFIVLTSNLITECPWLESDILKQTNLHIPFFGLCIRCPSYTRKTTKISTVHQAICSTSLIIQTHKTMTSPTESL